MSKRAGRRTVSERKQTQRLIDRPRKKTHTQKKRQANVTKTKPFYSEQIFSLCYARQNVYKHSENSLFLLIVTSNSFALQKVRNTDNIYT